MVIPSEARDLIRRIVRGGILYPGNASSFVAAQFIAPVVAATGSCVWLRTERSGAFYKLRSHRDEAVGCATVITLTPDPSP